MWDLGKYGNNIAIKCDDGRDYTYKQLDEEVSKFNEHIDGRCLVMLECRNKVESIVAYVSMINNRIVPIMMSGSDKERIQELAEGYKPRYICVYEDGSINDYSRIGEYGEINILKRNIVEDYDIHNDLALLLSTSGSTGSKKHVCLSYNNIRANTESIIDYLKIEETDATITSMPMSYTYGLSLINTYLYSGATILVTGLSVISKKFWDFFEGNNGTSFSGVPYTYEILVKMGFLNKKIDTLKVLTQAGGKLSKELQRKIGEYAISRGIRFYIMYGQTEATARMTYLPPENVLTKSGSVGVVVKGGEISIADDGEIYYTGENVYMGYAHDYRDVSLKGLTQDAKRMLRTGDIGYLDEDGYLYITGRNKDFVKISGIRINLSELVEKLSERYGGVFKCGVEGEILIVQGEKETIAKEELVRITGLNAGRLVYKNTIIIPNENGKI